jgi:hypothetical protein
MQDNDRKQGDKDESNQQRVHYMFLDCKCHRVIIFSDINIEIQQFFEHTLNVGAEPSRHFPSEIMSEQKIMLVLN